MKVTAAMLCDFAQVRDGLLFVASGGVTRLYRHDLPAPLGIMVAVVVDVPLPDAGTPHTLTARVVNRHNAELAALTTTFQVGDEGLFPHEVQQVPLVLSVSGVTARSWGTHQLRLWLDDEPAQRLTFYVVPSPLADPLAAEAAATESAEVADEDGAPA